MPQSNLCPPISAITPRLCCEPDMRLEDLARGVPGAVLEGNGDVEVGGIAYDSRQVKPGDLFVAVKGINSDGHSYLAGAIAAGAAAVAVDRPVAVPAGTPIMRVPSTRAGLAEIAAEFYGRPSRLLYVAGITGTDGKTTVTHMAEHVLMASGVVAGAMSTVAFSVGGNETDNNTGQTTTEAPQVQEWLRRMVDAGVKCAVIETTSHALVQERVRACDFDVAAFTNVGHDHMDYHATWEDYLEAKARLIELAAAGAQKGIEKTAVLNRDDPSYERLSRHSIPRRWSYGLTTASDLHPLDLSMTATGSRFRLRTPLGETEVSLAVPARFNVYNALCAAGVCLAVGAPALHARPADCGLRLDRTIRPRPARDGQSGRRPVRLFHHHHRRPAPGGPVRDREGRAVRGDRQVSRQGLRGRDRPPRRHPTRDRGRPSGRHGAAGRQGPRAHHADGRGRRAVGRARGGRVGDQGEGELVEIAPPPTMRTISTTSPSWRVAPA